LISNSRIIQWLGPNVFKESTRNVQWRSNFDAVFQIQLTTVCGSDLRIAKYGDDRIVPPRILGHEISARVVDPGSLESIKEGDFVAIGADIPCGNCKYCKVGRSNLCTVHSAIGYQLDGGFADHLVIPNEFLEYAPIVKIENNLYPELYALAEPTGCAINGMKFSGVTSSDEVLIYGGGPVGMILALLVHTQIGVPKDRIIVIEPSAGRRVRVADFGFTSFESGTGQDLCEVLPWGASQIFTANSAIDSHHLAIANVQPGGTINFFGGVPKDSPALQIHSNFLHYQEVKIGGSHGSSPKDHREAVNVIDRESDLWRMLLTKTYPLLDLQTALKVLSSGDELKVGVKPN
jgi:L-iditol 2-dehydrogenase